MPKYTFDTIITLQQPVEIEADNLAHAKEIFAAGQWQFDYDTATFLDFEFTDISDGSTAPPTAAEPDPQP